jgi:protoporphyrinogen oxidase
MSPTSEAPSTRRVVIIGGGAAGLAAAYDLSGAGMQVTVIEAAPDFGGLASSFTLEGHAVERFYHFICRSDQALIRLVGELALDHKLFWRHTQAAFYHHGHDYDFGTPASLLKFTPVPLFQRFRFGLHVLQSRYRKDWESLDRISAKEWLIESVGPEAYEVIWHPLLSVKFGPYHESISAAWLWHRIWRVARSRRTLLAPEEFGYLEYGSATLVDTLLDVLRSRPNVTLRLNTTVCPLALGEGAVTEVRTAEETFPCDAVISTVALPVLGRLVADRRDTYFENVRRIEYIGIACLLMSLKRSFSTRFWTNVNDPRISFNGFIEQTNLNRNLQLAGLNVLYIPFYLPTTHARFTSADDALLAEYVPMLRLMNPSFDESWIKEWHVFRAPYAQPIFDKGFLSRMPAHRTSVRGLYVTDATQFYPEDRTISAAVTQGRKVAAMIAEDFAPGAR